MSSGDVIRTYLALNTQTINGVVSKNLSSDSKPVLNFSGQIRLEPIIVEGKPAIEVSGLSGYGSDPNISVTGPDLVPISTSETRIQQIKTNATLYIGVINAPTTINQSPTVHTVDFNDVFQLLQESPLENREELRKLITEFEARIKTNSLQENRSFFKQIDTKLKDYPAIKDALIMATAKVVTECLTLGL